MSEQAPDKRQPIFNAPPATLGTCGALILCQVLYWLAAPSWQIAALAAIAYQPTAFLAQFDGTGIGPTLLDSLPLVGHAFLHADFMHLLLNAGFLLAFGSAVERCLGPRWFLVIFLAAAAGGALTETLFDAGPILMIGASGAVYGMMGAVIPFLFRPGIAARRRRMIEFVAVIMALNLLVGAVGLGDFLAGAEIAWRAHIGGFATGIALSFILTARTKGR